MGKPEGFKATLAPLRAFLFGIALALPAAAQDGGGENHQVVFAGYNLKNYLKMDRTIDGEKKVAPKPENEVAAVVSMLKKIEPNLLGVTEIGQEEDLKDLQTRLSKEGIHLPHATLCVSFDEDRRVGLLSRFPIVATNHQTDLTYTLDATRLSFKRGILDATVEVKPGYRLRLLGTHLKSKREIEEADQEAMRRNESHLLRRHINSILTDSPETNVLVFGDFNDTRNEQPIKAIQGRYGTDAYLKGHPGKR